MDTNNCCGLHIGQEVPDFEIQAYLTAQDQFGKIRLSDILKDKWVVLFFYPADFTFVCPTELADLADKYEEIRKTGTEVISVSTDTHFVHMAWRKDEKLLANVQFAMGSDPNGRISRLFGVYDKESGFAFRGTFIISPERILVGSEINFFNVGRNADELVRKLKAFVYVRENPAEVCPAKWDTGKKTLKPGKEIVGKVYEALK